MAQVVIQKAVLADAKELQRFFRLEEKHHAELYPDYFVPQAADVPLPSIEEDIRAADSVLLVAKDAEQPVGFLHGKLRTFSKEPQFREITYLMIEDCFVEQAYRRSGIATQLMQEARAWAVRKDVHRVQLQVWARNQDAAQLYRELGFVDLISRMELRL